jgi:hypothetical protein
MWESKLLDRLRARLARVGAELDDQGMPQFCNLDAPRGYLWACNGCMTIVVTCGNRSQTWLAEALRDTESELAMGLDKVTDPDELARCRHDYDDAGWQAPADAPDHLDV